jgi:hypothetical protein
MLVHKGLIFFRQVNWTNNTTNRPGKRAIEIASNNPQVNPGTLSFMQTPGPGGTWNYLIYYTITWVFTSSTN